MVVVGCASGAAPVATETVTVSAASSTPIASASPTTSPTGTPAVPDCETLVPLEIIRAQPGWGGFEFIAQATDPAEAAPLPGPLAREIAANARSRQDCTWGAPNSDSGIGVDVLQIDVGDEKKLVDALTAAPEEYEAFEIDGRPAFLTHAPWGIGEGVVVYAFDDGAWVIMGGHEYDQRAATTVVGAALSGMGSAAP